MPNGSRKADMRPDYSVGRPRVGPADPATVRAKLREREAEREPAIYGKGAAPKPAAENPTRDLSAAGAAKKLKGMKSLRDRQIEDAGG